MTQTLSQLIEIIEQREPTEEEASNLGARISDDNGEYSDIDITQAQVEVLKAKELIYYCAYCTRTTIRISDDYAAREYHTREALCDVDNPEAYLAEIVVASY